IPLDRSVAHAHERLARKRADLTWMQGVALELAASAPPPAATGESLLVIIDRSARESGLAGALEGSEPGGPGSLSVRLAKAPFDALVGWLARLAQQNGISVESATIEKTDTPGLVNAAHIAVTAGAGNLDAEVELGFGRRVTVRQARADLPLDPALIPGLPGTLHGRAHLDLALAQFEHGIITALQGRIEARDLEDRSGAATPLGSYLVTFPGGPGEPTGKLRDLD